MPSRIHQSRAVPSVSSLLGTNASTTDVLPFTVTDCNRTRPLSTSTAIGAVPRAARVTSPGAARLPSVSPGACTTTPPPALLIAASTPLLFAPAASAPATVALRCSAVDIATSRWSARSSQPSGIRNARAAMAVVAALT